MSTQSIESVDQANLALVQKFYGAIFKGDWGGVEQCVSEDIVVYEAQGLPYGGEYHGIQALQELFAQVVSYWDDLNIEIKGVTAGDGYVVGVLQFSGSSKGTGQKISMPIAEISEFQNGRIASIKPVYWDTKTLSAALGV